MTFSGGHVLQSRIGSRDNHFNLIRLVAACAVIVSHVFQVVGHSGGIDPLTGWFKGQSLGAIAVLVFFAVSGFFVTQSFATNPSVRQFLVARALRIFPALALTLCATVLLGAILTTASAAVFWPAAVHYFQSNLTVFLSVPGLPGVFETNPNGPAANISLWTLDHEVACYLWVAICGGLGLIGRPVLMAAASVVVLIPYAAELSAAVELPVFRYAFAFVVGQFFWVVRSKIILSPVLAVGLGVAAFALYRTAFFLPVFTLAIAYATFCIGFARLPRSTRFFQRADYSYGVYLYGFPIQQTLVQFGVVSPLWNVLFALPLALGCAAISWHVVEKPALGLKARAGHRPVRTQAGS